LGTYIELITSKAVENSQGICSMISIVVVFSKHKNKVCILEEITYHGEWNFKNSFWMIFGG